MRIPSAHSQTRPADQILDSVIEDLEEAKAGSEMISLATKASGDKGEDDVPRNSTHKESIGISNTALTTKNKVSDSTSGLPLSEAVWGHAGAATLIFAENQTAFKSGGKYVRRDAKKLPKPVRQEPQKLLDAEAERQRKAVVDAAVDREKREKQRKEMEKRSRQKEKRERIANLPAKGEDEEGARQGDAEGSAGEGRAPMALQAGKVQNQIDGPAPGSRVRSAPTTSTVPPFPRQQHAQTCATHAQQLERLRYQMQLRREAEFEHRWGQSMVHGQLSEGDEQLRAIDEQPRRWRRQEVRLRKLKTEMDNSSASHDGLSRRKCWANGPSLPLEAVFLSSLTAGSAHRGDLKRVSSCSPRTRNKSCKRNVPRCVFRFPKEQSWSKGRLKASVHVTLYITLHHCVIKMSFLMQSEGVHIDVGILTFCTLSAAGSFQEACSSAWVLGTPAR